MIRRNFIFPVLLTAALFVSSAAQAFTYTVTNTDDSGAGSLRQAILDTINDGGGAIVFNVPGTAPFVISPTSPLPSFSQNIIDGSTQPGFAGSPIIILDGSLLTGSGTGLTLTGSSTLLSLNVRNFSESGVEIQNLNNTVQNSTLESNAIGILANATFGLNTIIQGNFISNNEEGIRAQNGAHGIQITQNLITANLQNGIAIDGLSSSIKISQNSIHSNGSLGIDLSEDGVTANDADDQDDGGNHLQNFPTISLAQSNGCGSLNIEGSLTADPGRTDTYDLEFFSNPEADASGHGEGETYLTTLQVTPVSGLSDFQMTSSQIVPIGNYLSATAIQVTNGHTSEFSPVLEVTPLVVPGEFGTVNLSTDAATLDENAGQVSVTLARTCGFSGPVSVDVTTVDGTALAGQDYEASSQTVTFADGETEKTIALTITDDADDESDETFQVTLSNPIGGVTLGVTTTQTVTVTDNDNAAGPSNPSPTGGDGIDDTDNDGPGGGGSSNASTAGGCALIQVTKTQDTLDGTCDATDCSLREAVIAANQTVEADTIVLPAGVYALRINGASEDASATGDLDILGETTIEGAGADSTAIDAALIDDRIFHIPSGTGNFTLSGVTLRNGTTIFFGGALYSDIPADITLRDCAFAHNSATHGGAVYLDNNHDVLVSDCTFDGNSVSNDGGAIYVSTDGGFASQVRIEDSSFSSNVADNNGGAIYRQGDNDDGELFELAATVVDGNAASNYAGGVYTESPTVITDSVIKNNIAARCAGMNQDLQAGPMRIERTAILGNVVIFLNNNGGGACLKSVTEASEIVDSIIANNSAGFGGGLYVERGSPPDNGVLNITNTTISGNEAVVDNGGGLYIDDEALEVHLTNVTLADNESFTPPSNLLIFGSTNVTAVNTLIADGVGTDNCAFFTGGVLTSLGHNIDSGTSCGLNGTGDLSSTDPLLAALADNGGPTLTQALQASSPAIDAGDSAHCPTTDQRGETRPTACDIGAFELTSCGDGVVQTGEACDGGDTCNTDCTLKSDGNGSGSSSSGGCSLMR